MVEWIGFEGVFVNRSRIAAVQIGLLLVAVLASATVKNETIRIKILDSETRSVSLGGNDVPKNCDQVNFDAYCNNSKSAVVTNTLRVQVGDGPSFRITCTVDSKWSRCASLPKGQTFDAKREKRGVTVYYEDENGKPRKQLYTLVDAEAEASLTAASVAAKAVAPAAENTRQTSTAVVVAESSRESVKCSFSSTPAGAEVTLDGRYVGSTPSVVNVSTGNHVVVITMPGFAQWKRDLGVSPGSELTVNAVLQKAQ